MSGANESWSMKVDHNHWYGGALEFALQVLIGGGSCLVIGSPPAEANALAERGWAVTYLDVREPPEGQYRYIYGDAMHMPFEDDSFDALSSTCVLCHAGLGRYGDPVTTHGDEKMLAEIRRVVKPNGLIALMWGPYHQDTSSVEDTTHRIYCERDARQLAVEAGLTVVKTEIWRYLDTPAYLCMEARK